MRYKKVAFWGTLIAAIVIVGGAVAYYACTEPKGNPNDGFIINPDELPSAKGERVVRYVSPDGALSENPDESIGKVELWID